MGDRTSLPAHSNGTATPAKERRKHQRREPRELVYIDLGPDNCGFILDVSEGGISFKGISSLRDGQMLKVRFRLPGTEFSIEAEGQFVRPADATNSSVLKFLNLPDEVRTKIREWVAMMEQEPPAFGNETTTRAVPAAATVTPRLFEHPAPAELRAPILVASDGIAPVSSILAQAIAKNNEGPGLSADPHADALDALAQRITSNSPKQPAAPQEPPPAASPASSPIDIPVHPEVANAKTEEWPKEPFELTIRPTPKASVEASIDGASKQSHIHKGLPISGFTAGIVVGCVVLASVGGGLVATGRLRLVSLSSPPGIVATAAPSVSNGDAVGSPITGQSPDVVTSPDGVIIAQTPAASVPAKVQSSPLDVPPAAAPATTAALRKEPTRKQSLPRDLLDKQPTASSKASTARTQNVEPAAAAMESATSSEQARTPENTSSVHLDISRPVEHAQEAPGSADAQAPSLSTGTTQSVPELGADTPAAVSRASVSSPVAETFASPQMEEKSAPPKRTAKGAPSSASVFAAPDPNGAKPSSIEPAKLVLYVDPVYPAAARAAKIQGNVDVLATIGKDGVPRSLEAVNGDPRLAAAAIAAISNWRYRPATLNGQPEESLITITVKFAL